MEKMKAKDPMSGLMVKSMTDNGWAV
jgi:hypothetical protein